ncbi:2Fe-2S iron-sulfur cluster-binding protein [Tepidiforma sp.]|uniref:2Fe-2S iron-sulfur cluster-binding protein n=1 Tax=Tepidiforma sp. TaxID=2682230 RepID=UPI002ADE345C|nr:2Fe-2S iron-sulfur cluster-binding protein [Tepidiforma sp.]
MRVDGREAPPRGTILDAVLALGISLPHLCKDDNLPPIGACRTCLVEADGRVVAACHTPAEGITEVSTGSPRVVALRTTVLELTRGMHGPRPDIAGGPSSGELWAAYEAHRLAEPPGPRRERSGLDASSPFFAFHEQQCILCGRCVAACQQLQHIGAIGIAGRGTAARVTPGAGATFADSACTACGSCVAACPTHALVPKEGRA